MPFLGIDQSLTATGVCLVGDDGKPSALFTVDPGSRRGAERLSFVKEAVSTLLGPIVQFVCFEGYSYDSTSRQHALGEVGGVLKLLVYEHHLPYLEVSPASLKKFATGKSTASSKRDGASKGDMIMAAEAEGIAVADDNQADAYFLATVARFFFTKERPLKRAQMEVLRQLAAPQPRARRRVRRMIKHAL